MKPTPNERKKCFYTHETFKNNIVIIIVLIRHQISGAYLRGISNFKRKKVSTHRMRVAS